MFEKLWAQICAFFEDVWEHVDELLWTLIRIALILVVAHILIRISKRIIRRSIRKRVLKHPDSLAAKKAETLATMLNSIVKYTVYFFAAASILGVVGLGATVGSLLATAGIGGVALGLGAQTFIKDVVSGFFLLLEDQFAVGDYIETGEYAGTVESISLRTTRLRRANNEIVTIPNGLIDAVVNYTRDNYNLYFDIYIAYDQDISVAQRIMMDAAARYAAQKDACQSGPIPMGVVSVEPNRVLLRLSVYVKPLAQWEVSRELNRAVSESFKGIRVPDYENMVVVNGAAK